MGAIYRIWNVANGKSYVGQSSKPCRRILQHLTPGKPGGSAEIQKDLLIYESDVWRWKIEADEKDYPGVTLDQLERAFIRRWDSYKNGYNAAPGGGVRSSVPTSSETTLRKLLDTTDTIKNTIADYQFKEVHGISRSEYEWQQKIIAEYGSLEAYEQHRDQEEKLRKEEQHKMEMIYTFFWPVVILSLGLISLLAQC